MPPTPVVPTVVAVVALVALVAPLVVLLIFNPPTANPLPAMDPTRLIAVVLVFAVTFGVLLIFGAPPVAALFVGAFGGLAAAALMAKGRQRPTE